MIRSLALLALTGVVSAGTVQHDFGQPSDTSNAPIRINVGEPDWSAVWETNREDLTNSTMVLYENEDELRWVFKPTSFPTSTKPYVDARAIKFRRFAKFHFTKPAGAKYLSIRFKDDLMSPVPIKSGNQTIGFVGGTFDHQWKTVTLQGDINSPIVIGSNYSNNVSGMFAVDHMRVSDNDSHGFPADAPGYWPEPAENRHTNLGVTNDYGDGPMFLFGMYTRAFYLGNADANRCSSGPTDTFQALADVGMNVIVQHGWEMNWGSRWAEFPAEANWAKPNILTEMGLDELLFHAKCHGLKVIPNYLTDTRSYFMRTTNETSPAVVDRLTGYAARHADDRTLLAHNPVDEWDHEDVAYTKPHAVSQAYYASMKDAAPDTPHYMSLMGYMGPLAWEIAAKSTDILANDKYCHENKYPNGDSDLSSGCKEALGRMREMQDVVGNTKVRVYIPNFGEYNAVPQFDGETRLLNQKEQVFQAYTGIVGGAQGLVFFADINRQNNTPGLAQAWDGMEQLGAELFGEEGIAEFLVAPSQTVEGVASSSNPSVEVLLRQAPNGDLYLITLNMENSAEQTTITVTGMDDGRHPVLFEGRSVDTAGGKFTDEYAPLERHVYRLTGDGVEPPPVDPCDINPSHPDCSEPPPVDPCDIYPSLPQCNEPPIEPPVECPACPPTGVGASIHNMYDSEGAVHTQMVIQEDTITIKTSKQVEVVPSLPRKR